jgi:thioredoxin 1
MEAIHRRADLDRLVAMGGSLVIAVVDGADSTSMAFTGNVRQVSGHLPAVTCAVLDRVETPDLAALFGIDQAPALVVFRAGVGLFAGPAPSSDSLLEALLRRAMALDMDAVRTEMSRERAASEGTMAHRACPTSQRIPPDA